MRKCDIAMKEKRYRLRNVPRTNNIKYYGIETPIRKGMVLDKNISVLILELDAKRREKSIIKQIAPEHWQQIDRDARNCFSGGTGAGTLKSVYGYNHYGSRNAVINEELHYYKYPRCNALEDCQHIILCPATISLKEEYVLILTNKLQKKAKTDKEK